MMTMALRLYSCGGASSSSCPLPLLLVQGRSRSRRPWQVLVRSSVSQSALYSSSPSPPPPSSPSSNLTTHALGTLYESHCQASLETLLPGLSLHRVGGSGDRGVDLRGWLNLDALESSLLGRRRRGGGGEVEEEKGREGTTTTTTTRRRRRVRVVVQCKATNRLKEKKLGPVVLRELEGVMGRIQLMLRSGMDDERDLDLVGEEEEEEKGGGEGGMVDLASSSGGSNAPPSVLAILCSSSGFSKQTMLQATNQVEGNVMLVHLPLPEGVRLSLGSVDEEESGGGGEINVDVDVVVGTNGDGDGQGRQVEDDDDDGLGATAEATSAERQLEDSMSTMLATPATAASRASQPLSILLSSRLRNAGPSRRLASGTTPTRTRTGTRTDALMGRLSVGTRRSLIEGGGETSFLLWDGVELGRGGE